MAINWNFDDGSRFSHFLTKLGLLYRDEMIDFMLISYHRYLNQRPQEVKPGQTIRKKRKRKTGGTKKKKKRRYLLTLFK